MKALLNKLKPLKTDLIPPEGSIPAGMTADGKHVLFKRPIKKVTKKVVLDEQGDEVWKKHPSGEPMVRKRTATVTDGEELFYLLDHGNGNVEKVRYQFPTPEQQAVKERQAKIAAMQPALAAALVDANVRPQDLATLFRGATTPATAPTPPAPSPMSPPAEEEDFPVELGEGKWKLSNGQVVEAPDEDKALALELEVLEARRNANLVPEG